ncbi:hypothetical protein PFISCL1PPCAC_7677, partial [Pristionchus fissidentatus]
KRSGLNFFRMSKALMCSSSVLSPPTDQLKPLNWIAMATTSSPSAPAPFPAVSESPIAAMMSMSAGLSECTEVGTVLDLFIRSASHDQLGAPRSRYDSTTEAKKHSDNT